MEENIEVEYKTLVAEAVFYRLLSGYPGQPIRQCNTYFDTPDFANRRRHVTIRIRTIDAKYRFTIKVPTAAGTRELSCQLDGDDLTAIRASAEAQSLLAAWTIEPDKLEKKGKLETLRYLNKLDNAELCLDLNHYNGNTDYEVEYEITGHGQDHFARFLDILAPYGIVYQKSQPKIVRCFNSLN